MYNKIKKLLYDILTSINKIEDYIGKNKNFNSYNSNPMLQDAVERNIEIIGEAMNKVLKLNTKLNISNTR